jgi:hypothetical protein
MKIDHVYVRPDGVICACTVPVPEKTNALDDRIEWIKYKKALQSCKDSAVCFEYQYKIRYQLWYNDERINSPIPQMYWWENMIKTDSFYPLKCEVDIIQACAHDSCPVDAGCEHCKEPVKVARLITNSTMEFPQFKKTSLYPESTGTVATSGTKPVDEESYDDTFRELVQILLKYIQYDAETMIGIDTEFFKDEVKKKFTLTRKK